MGGVCVYFCRTYYKAVGVCGGDIGGHVLRETTSRGLCGLVCPSRTNEREGEGDCVKEGGGGEGKCVCLLLQYLVQSCSRLGGGGSGGHVLRETTSRGLCELVCPSVCVYY